MPKPRVLMLPKWYPNRYDDQDGDFVARHAAAIAPHAQCAVVFAAVARQPLLRLLECEADLSATVPTLRYYYRAHPTGLAPLDRLLKLCLYFWCMQRGYRRVCQHWGGAPDLVHAHVLLRTGVWARWLRWRHGLPYLITEHWTLYQPQNAHRIGRARRWLTQLVVRQANALHTVSENLREALARLGAVNAQTVVIPNVVDTTLFALPTQPRIPHVLLHVAAFNEQAKNLSGVLRTVARLRPTWPQLHLRIVGYGPAETTLRHLAAELGLLTTDTVSFLGKLPPAAVARHMQEASCLVLFSNYENLPCVLIEAQASGLPAVATAVGGVPELLPVTGRYGLLVPPADEPALATALATVLHHPDDFGGPELRQRAEACYSYEAVGRQFAALYAALLSPAGLPHSAV